MIIGVPKEIKTDEYRVALTPAGARELTGAGHRVLIERGAGVGSSIVDADYVANGATIVESADDVWSESDLLMKVKEPVAPEYHRMSAHQNQVLFTYLHLAASRQCTDALVAAASPETPAPITTTLAGATPGTPLINVPCPPPGRIR